MARFGAAAPFESFFTSVAVMAANLLFSNLAFQRSIWAKIPVIARARIEYPSNLVKKLGGKNMPPHDIVIPEAGFPSELC